MDDKRHKSASSQRVYEYEDDNGVVYYSFTRQPNTLSPPVRLRIKSRIGTHVVNFLAKLRQVGQTLGQPDEDVG